MRGKGTENSEDQDKDNAGTGEDQVLSDPQEDLLHSPSLSSALELLLLLQLLVALGDDLLQDLLSGGQGEGFSVR